ncbi:MAG: PVC-type heme-binding CxxCH protein, partial [Verrucomicrobiota bacterium]
PDLKNPVQLAFDNKGRLWVATMESYPHYRIGDPKPKDKLIILEDRDKDGVADHQINFADDLHIPIGFEISHDGVYVSQSGSLVLLKDEDGDDRYDTSEVLLSGFDDHDTHHAISAFCADPSGAFIMCEGIFLHSNTESAYGPSRGTNGGFYRYSPQRKQILRYSQFKIPNPWGVAFDDYGQDFFLHTSGPKLSWMLPGTGKVRYGANLQAPDLLTSNQVRPTSGVEFVSSRHFPDEVQGDILINNNIGYLGAKQHRPIENGTGFTTEFVQDLFVSEDRNFRPTDLEFAPDGSLYVIDWHNALIGHMQHNARDPNRDHVHGRIFRVTYPDRPLVEEPVIDGASIAELLENLKLPESRARYRTRRELRERDAAKVTSAAGEWAMQQEDERLKLEALWVTWGADQVDQNLLAELLESEDHRIRSAAVRVARFNEHQVENLAEILREAANDNHGRVRLEAATAATYQPAEIGAEIVALAKAQGLDEFNAETIRFADNLFDGTPIKLEEKKKRLPRGITKNTPDLTTVQINCVVEGIKFDVKTVKLNAGKKVRLIFNNPDVMQHNLVVVKPGTADTVANAALLMGAEGFTKEFLPETDDIIIASRLLNANEKQVLTFTLDEPGTYPFVCTFPGHAMMMRGTFEVQ